MEKPWKSAPGKEWVKMSEDNKEEGRASEEQMLKKTRKGHENEDGAISTRIISEDLISAEESLKN
jgi:hypothetical protein